MKAIVVTTITSSIDIDTFETTHEVDVATEDPLPRVVVLAAATGGCRSALRALRNEKTSDAAPLLQREDP